MLQFSRALFSFLLQQHSEEMKQNLDQVKLRRKYSEEIASERKARKLQAEETGEMMVSLINVRFLCSIYLGKNSGTLLLYGDHT